MTSIRANRSAVAWATIGLMLAGAAPAAAQRGGEVGGSTFASRPPPAAAMAAPTPLPSAESMAAKVAPADYPRCRRGVTDHCVQASGLQRVRPPR